MGSFYSRLGVVTLMHILLFSLLFLKKVRVTNIPPKLHVETITLHQRAEPVATACANPQRAEEKPRAVKSPTKTEELKKLLQQSLSSLNQTSSEQVESEVKKMGELQCEVLAYETLLANSLKEQLELPEEGEIRLTLTLNKQGRVLAHKILFSSSLKNQKYVEESLAYLRLPSYEFHEVRRTFPITLKTY